MVNIAALSGIRDIWALLSIWALTATTNMFGLMSETYVGELKTLGIACFLLGFIPFIIPWVQIFDRFYVLVGWFENNFGKVLRKIDPDEDSEIGRIPDFVIIVLMLLAVLYFIFPTIQFFQKITGSITYERGEAFFVLASLISKVALSWFVFVGAFREDSSYIGRNPEENLNSSGNYANVTGISGIPPMNTPSADDISQNVNDFPNMDVSPRMDEFPSVDATSVDATSVDATSENTNFIKKDNSYSNVKSNKKIKRERFKNMISKFLIFG